MRSLRKEATSSLVRSSDGALSTTKISNGEFSVCSFNNEFKQRARFSGRSLVQMATVRVGNCFFSTVGIISSLILSSSIFVPTSLAIH